ncbi:beta-class carbonic anhydrase [Megasphaera vaginalis (ex Bordigoni et al. 2020)]|uniref:beta-class carbonic anhydrase n=1 Tax=Megasphaera vaginalis (ex Bordigoni et al. 2020) TaxID=2045301 RepID=UPI000C7CEE94|nr:carbonic anhydrase [Megasphaera vaginalis (ex Bordigoni et al. 2020)]
MAQLLAEIEAANAAFLAGDGGQRPLRKVGKMPRRRVVILTCMDTRLVELLEPAMGIRRGEAKIVKVAGNTVGDGFDSVMGSLLVAVYELGVEAIIVVGHEGCGMLATTAASLLAKMAAAGVAAAALDKLRPSLVKWADSINCVEGAVAETVRRLRQSPYFPDYVTVYGAVMDPETGALRIIDRGREDKHDDCK